MEDPATNCGSRGHRQASSIDNRTLYSWGANSHGQLGQGDTEDRLLPVAVGSDLLPRELQQTGISCIGGGGGFSFIVIGGGHVLTCGNNDRGQLGLDQSSDVQEPKVPNVSVFTPSAFLSGVKVTKAASGWDFMLALTDNGTVYSWGSNSFCQLGRQLDESEKMKHSSTPGEVVFSSSKSPQHDIAAGLRHSLSVSVEGHVFAWGHGKKGQLGSEVKKGPGGKSVVTMPRKESGSVYIWGCNAYGQCCVNPDTSTCVVTPAKQHIPCKDGERVVAVRSGWTHLVACTDKGNLYSWGRSNLGQLGRQCEAGCDPVPGPVEGLINVTTHGCGSEHNIALSDGKVYTWGWNEHGICATGDETDVPLPRHVTTLSNDSTGTIICGVGCGTGHSFAIFQQGR